MGKPKSSAVVGALFLIPALMAIFSGVLRVPVPDELIHPVLVAGGMCAALVMNLLAVLRVTTLRRDGHLAGVIVVQIGNRLANLAVIATSSLIAATIMLYLFVENFQAR